MKRISLKEKELPSRPCSIAVASNSLEKLASAHVRMGSRLRSHFSHWRSTTAIYKYKVTIKRIMGVLSFYTWLIYGNSGVVVSYTTRLWTHTTLGCVSCCMSLSPSFLQITYKTLNAHHLSLIGLYHNVCMAGAIFCCLHVNITNKLQCSCTPVHTWIPTLLQSFILILKPSVRMRCEGYSIKLVCLSVCLSVHLSARVIALQATKRPMTAFEQREHWY